MIKDTDIESMRDGQADNRDQAFERLWQDHRQRVWRLVARIAGGIDAADDLTQEVSIRAYRAYPEFRGESSVSTWLYRIAVNVGSAARFRHRRRGD